MSRPANASNVVLTEPGQFQEMPHQTGLERLVAVHWNRKPNDAAVFSVDMMASGDTQKHPAMQFDGARQLLAGDGFQTAISTILPVDEDDDGSSTERQPSIASRRFSVSSLFSFVNDRLEFHWSTLV
jgi:hypothetical protein